MITKTMEQEKVILEDDIMTASRSEEETISIDDYFELLRKEVKHRYENL